MNAGEGAKPPPESSMQLAETGDTMVDAPQSTPIHATPIQVEPSTKAPIKYRLVSDRPSPKAKAMLQRASDHSNSALGGCFSGNDS